jgi:hypothetical protein
MSSCKYVEKVMKDRVHCPSCTRDYEIVLINHACPKLSRCGPKGSTYVEKYLDADTLPTPAKEKSITGEHNVVEQVVETLASSAPNAECNLCETARKSRITARKATCPDCNYNGYYVHTEDKLCPACKAAKSAPVPVVAPKVVKKKSETPLIQFRSIVEDIKPRMVLYFKLLTTGNSPETGTVISVCVLGCTRTNKFPEVNRQWYITPQDVPQINEYWIENWADKPNLWEQIISKGVSPVTAMHELSELLTDLSQEYELAANHHDLACGVAWMNHIYNKYAPENKFCADRLF